MLLGTLILITGTIFDKFSSDFRAGQVSFAVTPSSNDNATRQAKNLSEVVLKTSAFCTPEVDNLESTRFFPTGKEGSNSLTDKLWFQIVIGSVSGLAFLLLIVLAVVLLRGSRCRRVEAEESNEGETADKRNGREMAYLASSPGSNVVDLSGNDR